MNVGYSVSKLKAMIESNNKGGKAYALDNYDNNKLVKMTNLTQANDGASMIVFQDKIHVIGGKGYATRHEVWDGEKWTLLAQIPMYCEYSGVVIYKGALHVLGSDSSNYRPCHYKYDGTTWTKLETYTNESGAYTYINYGCTTDGENIYFGTNSYLVKYNDVNGYTRLKAMPSNFQNDANTMLYDEQTKNIRLFNQHRYITYNISSSTWGTLLTPFDDTNCSVGRPAICTFNDDIYCVPTPNYTSASLDNKIIFKFDKVNNKWVHVYKGDEFLTRYPNICVYHNELYIIPGKSTYDFYKYDYSKGIKGYVDENTEVYYPIDSYIIKGNMEIVDGGYINKTSGEIIIANK